jgi:hypothetical protein
VVFVAAGGLGVGAAQAGLWGWATIVLFGLGALLFLAQLMQPGTLVLRPDGFSVSALVHSWGYAWDVVSGCGVVRSGLRGERVVVYRVAGYAELPDTYGLPATELAALMEEWRAVAAVRSD